MRRCSVFAIAAAVALTAAGCSTSTKLATSTTSTPTVANESAATEAATTTTPAVTTDAPTTTAAAATTTTAAATTTTTAPHLPSAPTVKQGHVAVDKSALPAGFTTNGDAFSDGTTTYVPGYTGDVGTNTDQPAIAASTDQVTWQLSAPSLAGYKGPPGGYTLTDDVNDYASSVAAGAPGIVATAIVGWWRAPRRDVFAREDVAWFSTDGQTWNLIDFRQLVGGGTDGLIALANVQWLDNEFVITGASGPLDGVSGRAKGLVLVSADGVNWVKLAEPPTPWAVDLNQIMDLNGTLIVSGTEYVCTTDAGSITNFSVGGQPRLWSSADNGATWTNVPIPADALLGDKAAPADASGCPVAGNGSPPSLDQLDAYAQSVDGIGEVNGSIVVWSHDGATAYVTTDLANWSPLPTG